MHILNPHEPLVFDENGGVSTQQTFDGFLVQKQTNIDSEDENYKKSYINQIRSINKLTLNCIESILSQYPQDNQPIIILHGDHGRRLSFKDPLKYALGNLFALYIPEGWREKAKDLTFNNLYRFISNQLFQGFNGTGDIFALIFNDGEKLCECVIVSRLAFFFNPRNVKICFVAGKYIGNGIFAPSAVLVFFAPCLFACGDVFCFIASNEVVKVRSLDGVGGKSVLYAGTVIIEPYIFCICSFGEKEDICTNTVGIEDSGGQS